MFQRFFVRGICALIFAAVFLFAACEMKETDYSDTNVLKSALIGTWQSSDKYIITKNEIAYYGWTGSLDYAGAIVHVSNFSKTAGVIIIKYDPDNRQKYYSDVHWEDMDHYLEPCDDPEHLLPLKGDYLGIYFKDLVSGVSVEIGGAYASGGAEKATLSTAKKAFTSGNEGEYMGAYSICSYISVP